MTGRIRFDFGLIVGKEYLLTGELFGNLLLWKLRVGEAVTVVGSGERLFRGRVVDLGKDSAKVYVFEEVGVMKKPLEVTLLQALPEKERMELIIEKTAELGVARIMPFKAKRSISLEEREAKSKKAHRWQDVALKASKQCRRDTVAQVLPYSSFKEALALDAPLKLVLWEGKGMGFKDVLSEAKEKGVRKVSLLVGPEGGFDDEEIEEAREAGYIPVTLGLRVLRTETAAIMAVGITVYELGD